MCRMPFLLLVLLSSCARHCADAPANTADASANTAGDLYVIGIAQEESWNFLPQTFEQVLREQGKPFHQWTYSCLLVGENATRTKFMNAVGLVCNNAKPNDRVAIFIACRGNCTAQGESEFFTRDGLIRAYELKKELAKLPCQVIVVNDACQLDKWARGTPDDPMPPNVTVLCCCSATQNSNIEFDISLFEALYGRADFNKDGIVDLDEVIRYCGLRLTEIQRGGLAPVLRKATSLRDAFPLTESADNLVAVVHKGEFWSALLEQEESGRCRVRPGEEFPRTVRMK